MPAIFAQHAIKILFAIAWWLLITGVGSLSLKIMSVRPASQGEMFFNSFGMGLVITGYAVFLLGIAGALHPFTILVTLVSLAIASLAGWLRMPGFSCPASKSTNMLFRPLNPRLLKINLPVGNQVERFALILLGLLLAAGFILTLTPETGKDALIYHLAVPKLYLQHGGFYSIAGNIFADYPLLAEMHYLLGLFLQNDILAKTMNYAVLCEILLGIYLFARFLLKDHDFPILGTLIFLSIPSVFAVTHTAYNDLFVAYFTLAAFYCFLRWSQNRLTGWLLLFGVFSGAAIACKYMELIILPLGLLGILIFAFKDKSPFPETFLTLILYVVAVFAVGSPFYLKNLIATGNPFHPFLYTFFGGGGWDADQARLYDIMVQSLGMGRGLIDYVLLPFNLSFRAKIDNIAFDGVMGPVFFLALPFLAFIRREPAVLTIVIFSFFSFLFWASSAQQIRYLIPLFPLLAIVVGAILTHCRKQKILYFLLLCFIGTSLAFNGWYIMRDFIKISPLRVVAGLESRDGFLDRLIPSHPMYRFANENLPAGAKIFLIYMKNYTFFCKRDCYSDSMFETHTISKILRTVSLPEDIADALKKSGFTHIMYDERYLFGSFSPLSNEEQARFSRFRNQCLSLVVRMGPYRLDDICR